MISMRIAHYYNTLQSKVAWAAESH